jgi:hypothetical protein
MTVMKCNTCEYEPICFRPLKAMNQWFEGCRQGRRKREYKAKPVTLKEVLDAPANSNPPVP